MGGRFNPSCRKEIILINVFVLTYNFLGSHWKPKKCWVTINFWVFIEQDRKKNWSEGQTEIFIEGIVDFTENWGATPTASVFYKRRGRDGNDFHSFSLILVKPILWYQVVSFSWVGIKKKRACKSSYQK